MMPPALPTIPGGCEEPHAWWRGPCEAGVLRRVFDPGCMRELTAVVARVAPLARDLADAIARGDLVRLVAPAVRRPPADTFATDLIGSALMLEAAAGSSVARVLLDHMRRQRDLPVLRWPDSPAPASWRPPGRPGCGDESASP